MVYFPLAKLGFLLVKQITKPVTRLLKQKATSNKIFRNYVVAPPAQFFHWIGVRSKMRMLGLNQPKYVPPLNQAMAIETGSNLLSELIVVSIGVSLIILEFSRQARNDKLKHDKHKEQRQKLFSDLEALNDRVNEQVHEIQNLKVKLSQLSIRPVDE
ncbi:putative OPA3-like protein CG13603 isoform X1 [Drosophila sulfurigaster albostrigata]|uniref:putative OPA3-like protein CG13603 isoform X1 n=1 Tax=Drosophila sulfurigaster albostrigata TaxID=89887 RepID=UPI00295ED236|nr:putative OPA3-like protein CG13603 [Drosophila nasuta]XP_062124399.1 putative OPA3-like protein CG13603 isoform X1 [Drosophila sulfurigaster albostrigata]